jgi:hypothetical protein
MQPPFPSPPLPLHPRYFLVRASFANKESITAKGWGLGAYRGQFQRTIGFKTQNQHFFRRHCLSLHDA